MGDDLLGVIDLAIAIQLVAEQVEQHKVRRLELGQDAHGVELIAFKNAHALAAAGSLEAAARLEQCAHHARLHVVAGAVAYHGGAAGGNGVGDEVGGGGLAVGAGDHHAAVDKGSEVAQQLGVDLHGDAAGKHATLALKDGAQPPASDIARGTGKR